MTTTADQVHGAERATYSLVGGAALTLDVVRLYLVGALDAPSSIGALVGELVLASGDTPLLRAASTAFALHYDAHRGRH